MVAWGGLGWPGGGLSGEVTGAAAFPRAALVDPANQPHLLHLFLEVKEKGKKKKGRRALKSPLLQRSRIQSHHATKNCE